MKLKTSALLIAGALMGAAVIPAQADPMLDLLEVLRDKGTISAQDYELLTNAAKAKEEKTAAEQAEMKKEVESTVASMPKITTDGKLVVEDREGNWSFQPIGRVMWDAIDADADTNDSDDDAQGTELRRARLGFQGKIYDMGYKFESDFAGGDASIKDAYVSYGNSLTDTTKYGIKLGQSHVPFGLNTKISSKYMSFMDRPFFADTDWSPARQSGVVVGINDKDYKWALTAGLQNGGLGDGKTTDNGSTFAARASFVPYMASSTQLIQIGAGLLTRGGGDGFDDDQRLVSHIDTWTPSIAGDGSEKPLNLVVGSGEDDGSDAFTIDAMAIFGSFHAMAEYLDYTNDTTSGDIDTTGYAVEVGYFLTGESLKWKKGYTSGISPKSKYGAWQIAARFENMEIDQLTGNATTGDEADKFTLGVNYYPTKNTRLMLNYDKVTDLTVDGISRDEEPSSLKFRAQAFW